MFTAAFEEIFKRILPNLGISMNVQVLKNPRFADDIILLANKEEDLYKLLPKFNEEGKKDGMKMNKRKTKIMRNDSTRRKHKKGITVGGEKLGEVDEYKSPGKVLTPRNEICIEINQRVNAGWKRSGQ